jgi:hypothetical protein
MPVYKEEVPAWTKGPWFSKDGEQLNALREAWKEFAAGGRYRLAGKEDTRFSAEVWQARGAGEPYQPFAFVWGSMNYPRMNGRDHLVLIVSDTTRTDEKRLGLVVFSAPKDGGGRYEAYPVSHDADLSRAWINRGGSDFSLTEYPAGGGQRACAMRWVQERSEYVCGWISTD